MSYDRDRIEDVSEALSELRYSEMQELGRRLYDIAIDREEFSHPGKLTAQAFAEILSDWSTIEADIEAEEQAE